MCVLHAGAAQSQVVEVERRLVFGLRARLGHHGCCLNGLGRVEEVVVDPVKAAEAPGVVID